MMDPITAAILAALPALATDLVKSSVQDAYQGLKSAIRRKLGATSAVAKSVDELEANPKSKDQVTVLAENIAAEKLTSDPDVMRALARLVDELKTEGVGGKAVAAISVNVSGGTVQGIVGAENVSIGSQSFGDLGGRRRS
jgi:hypothetical protein